MPVDEQRKMQLEAEKFELLDRLDEISRQKQMIDFLTGTKEDKCLLSI